MKTKLASLFVFFLITIIFSCRESKCLDNNAIFSNNVPESAQYKKELANHLKKIPNSELFFFTEKVAKKDSTHLLYVSIKSDSLCAIGILHINNPNHVLDDLLKAKGTGYLGSQLKNLKYEIVHNDLIFKSVDAIID